MDGNDSLFKLLPAESEERRDVSSAAPGRVICGRVSVESQAVAQNLQQLQHFDQTAAKVEPTWNTGLHIKIHKSIFFTAGQAQCWVIKSGAAAKEKPRGLLGPARS